MKFIAIDTFNYDQLTAIAFDLGIKVRGRRDLAKTWSNAIRKELIKRAVKGINATGDRFNIAINFTVDAVTVVHQALVSPKAKELYRHLGVLLAVLWALVWWVITFLGDCADAVLGKLVVDRCLELPAEVPTPPADVEPIRPIVPALRKFTKVVKQHWQTTVNAVEMVDDVRSLFKVKQGGGAIAPITIV